MKKIAQVNKRLKDKKIKIFSIDIETNEREYLEGEFWAHYLSVTGKEYTATNTDTIKRQATFTINYNSSVSEGMYVEYKDLIYRIVFVQDGEGYTGGDLILSVITSKDADMIN